MPTIVTVTFSPKLMNVAFTLAETSVDLTVKPALAVDDT